MNNSLLIKIVSFSLCLLILVFTTDLQAADADSSNNDSDNIETFQAPRQMTEMQMNDLFGEDPYLGQTSYLQSPDGFNQKVKSK